MCSKLMHFEQHMNNPMVLKREKKNYKSLGRNVMCVCTLYVCCIANKFYGMACACKEIFKDLGRQ